MIATRRSMYNANGAVAGYTCEIGMGMVDETMSLLLMMNDPIAYSFFQKKKEITSQLRSGNGSINASARTPVGYTATRSVDVQLPLYDTEDSIPTQIKMFHSIHSCFPTNATFDSFLGTHPTSCQSFPHLSFSSSLHPLTRSRPFFI